MNHEAAVSGSGINERDLLRLARPVSRSFYLSLQFLPSALRPGVTLAYLLARASDTLADSMPMAEAPEALLLLQNWAEGKEDLPGAKILAGVDCPPGERDLLAHLPDLFECLRFHPHEDLIRRVWSIILGGQIADLKRVVDGTQDRPLNPDELDAYVYAVAGCVGEFWTELAARVLPGAFDEELAVLLEWGRSYGEALQWINIVRDSRKDAAQGRVYLTQDGIPAALARIESGLLDARRYAGAIRRGDLYFPTCLPAAIAEAMLPQLRAGVPGFKLSRLALLPVALRVLCRAGCVRWNRNRRS